MQRLTLYDREKLQYWRRTKLPIRQIAKLMRRDHSVIVRELQRNKGRYSPYTAVVAQRATERRSRITNVHKLTKYPVLHDYVEQKLRKGWSPELIAGRLQNDPPIELGDPQYRISHESIYRYIYGGEGRYEGWYRLLVRKQSKRRKQCGRKPKKVLIPQRVSIHDRPDIINERGRIGDWESDTVTFSKQKTALSVQYERRAQLTLLAWVADRSADETTRVLTERIDTSPLDSWKSITFDNGGEAARHTELRDTFGIDTYFCDAYASWQKGGVENTNGLIRRFLPRSTDLGTLTDDDLYHIQETINNRPRKSLCFKTPNEVMNRYLQSGALNS